MLKLEAWRCTRCFSCTVACQQERNLPAQLRLIEVERRFLALPRPAYAYALRVCCHCREPACLASCRQEALFFKDGLVFLREELCSGCGGCVSACPYGGIFMDVSRGLPVKCDLCARRREKGALPACVQTCPVGALTLAEGGRS